MWLSANATTAFPFEPLEENGRSHDTSLTYSKTEKLMFETGNVTLFIERITCRRLMLDIFQHIYWLLLWLQT